ncbi:MAG: hypothetical protein GWN58_30790, partial [Anaerolineae bacterium]|nr:hypothetical protein [Anaerolineae bacterium]
AVEGATPLQQELLDQIAANVEQMIALLGNLAMASDLECDGQHLGAQEVDMPTTEAP